MSKKKNQKTAPVRRAVTKTNDLPREFRNRAPDRIDVAMEAYRDGEHYIHPVILTWAPQPKNNSFTRYGEVNRFKGASLYEVMGKKEPPRIEKLEVLMSIPISFDILWSCYQTALASLTKTLERDDVLDKGHLLYGRVTMRLISYLGMQNPWFAKMMFNLQDRVVEGYVDLFMGDLENMGLPNTAED